MVDWTAVGMREVWGKNKNMGFQAATVQQPEMIWELSTEVGVHLMSENLKLKMQWILDKAENQWP